MFSKIGKTFLILSLTLFASMISTILLGRILNQADFGMYNLLKKIFLIGPSFCSLGLGFSFNKLYGNSENIPRKIFSHIYLLFLVTSLLFTVALFYLYGFKYFYILIIWYVLWMTAVIRLNAQYPKS